MIKDQFNINVLSDDPMFCTRFATECNKFGLQIKRVVNNIIFKM